MKKNKKQNNAKKTPSVVVTPTPVLEEVRGGVALVANASLIDPCCW